MSLVRCLFAVFLVTCVAAQPAAASGPPGIGGEDVVQYKVKVHGGGHLKIQMWPGTSRVTAIYLTSRRVIRCRHHGVSYRRWDVRLWEGNARVRAHRHLVERQHDFMGRTVYDLRFSPDWSRATLRLRTAYYTNQIGRCSGRIRLTAKRRLPKHWWALGGWAGTTSQGMPVRFSTTRQLDRSGGPPEYSVRNFTATVRFDCPDDGTSFTRDLVARQAPLGTDLVGDNGGIELELTPDGKEADQESPDWAVVDLEGKLTGSRASGTFGGYAAQNYHECEVSQVSFTASVG